MKIVTQDLSLAELKNLCDERLTNFIKPYLSSIPSPDLKYAMEYPLSNKGKYVRPLLVYATGSIFNTPLNELDGPAAAIELIHTFSLIHDDLPCMDNADLRRGKPTCHKEFGEALAVLAGDALQTLAFQVLANYPANIKADRRLAMLATLADATGAYGMTAGQAMDLSLSDPTLSTELLFEIYRLKTGNLISASIFLGYLASGTDDDFDQSSLQNFGEALGLAFQLQDDYLDMVGDIETLGKKPNIDIKNHKHTLAGRLGLQATQEKINSLYAKALESINYLGTKAQLLREVTSYLLQRIT